MKYKYKLLLYITALNLLLILGAVFLYENHLAPLWVLELLCILSALLGRYVYVLFSTPFDLLTSGVQTLKDQDFSIRLRKGKSTEFNQLIEVYNRMIEQLRKERIAHSEKNHLVSLLIDASPSGILLLNFDNQLKSMNKAAEVFVGHSFQELKNLPLRTISEICSGMFDEVVDSSNYIFRPDGRRAFRVQKGTFYDRGFLTQFLMIEDLSSEIYLTEKKSYEKVIRMMSHEVNTSVSAVNSILTTITPKLLDFPAHQNAVQVCIERNVNMNHFMRNFSDVVRLPKPVFSPVSIPELLHRVLLLFKQRFMDQEIEVVDQLYKSSFVISGDEALLEQCFLNIIKNSCDAMQNGGILRLSSSLTPLGLNISDTGVGISKENHEKMFTPFFSNKPTGQGIGLTIVRDVLTNHGCDFSLSSTTDETTFSIVFPKP